jgi:uncharacterized membrane protein
MREFGTRIAVMLISLVIVCVAAVASFAFLCVSVFDFLSTLLSPALAALATSFAIILVAGLFVAAASTWSRVRLKRRMEKGSFEAGRALGAMFARQFKSSWKNARDDR